MDTKISKLLSDGKLSPFRIFNRDEWANLRADTPLTLRIEEIRRLQSVNDRLGLEEVVEIYLPLSRLLSLYVAAAQGLFKATQRFLEAEDGKMPYIIGIAGSVAVGKSTTARVLEKLMARWPNTPKVNLITTDGFLLPNSELKRLNLMDRKGFPESYDAGALVNFLSRIKAGERNVSAPLYSHVIYDVVPEENVIIDRPDILIVEGLNVLQPPKLLKDANPTPFVSDFFDFSIYIDGKEEFLRKWYVDRFMMLRETSFKHNESFFHRYAEISYEDAMNIACNLWDNINLPNLRDNILPTRPRANLILRKGESHFIEEIALRKL